jgi:very-short-patch-repair endonuclease
MTNYTCQYCGSEKYNKNQNSFRNHERMCKMNPERQKSFFSSEDFQNKRKLNGGQNQYTKAKSLGLDKPSISDDTRKKFSNSAKEWQSKRSEEKIISHRSKISESMKIAHKEKRAWNIGKSRWNNKPSYPEIFFSEIIQNEFSDKEYIREFPIGIYSADFCWPHLKKVIEIDGSQHSRFEEYKERDKRKDIFLTSEGYKILRISWSDMCQNTLEKIKEAYNFIH